MNCGPYVYGIFEGVLKTVVIQSWGAFEALARTLWKKLEASAIPPSTVRTIKSGSALNLVLAAVERFDARWRRSFLQIMLRFLRRWLRTQLTHWPS